MNIPAHAVDLPRCCYGKVSGIVVLIALILCASPGNVKLHRHHVSERHIALPDMLLSAEEIDESRTFPSSRPLTEISADRKRLGLEDAAGWSSARTLAHGATIAVRVPGFVLSVSSMGYGALARDTGLDLGLTMFINATFFALPAQVVLVDQIARGAALSGAAFAVALTAIRLLPMTVSLIPLIRKGDRLPWYGVLAAHFVAISVWVEGYVRLPLLPVEKRLTYFVGMGLGMLAATLTGTTCGYFLASSVPPTIAAALLFMSPSFFLLSQVGTARAPADWVAVGLGCILGPVLYQLVPGLDLLLAGLIGGTIAFAIHKLGQS